MDDPYRPPNAPLQRPSDPHGTPKRHGCLTTWLVIAIIANAGTVIITPFSVGKLREAGHQISTPMVAVIVACGVANLACAFGLMRWKKWGFYGFALTTFVALLANIAMGTDLVQSAAGLIGIAVLYWVLNLGDENKAWPHLR
jgi:hypothetical protein